MNQTKKLPCFIYERIIQQNTSQGWEDVSAYAVNSRNGFPSLEARDTYRSDVSEYRASKTGAVRVIFRRSPANA